jgi:hypothetical protein
MATDNPVKLRPLNTLGVRAKLVPYRQDGEIPNPNNTTSDYPPFTEFYLNPESWTESKSANWVAHNVPGRSDPVLQWTSSGPRTITFEALVTQDISGPVKEPARAAAFCDATGGRNFINKIGSIAQKVLNIPGLSLDSIKAASNSGQDALDLNINAKLNYYRSLVYPNAFDNTTHPPNVVQLIVGETFGKRAVNSRFVVNRVDITITKQSPALLPFEAKVSFTLTEIVGRNVRSDTDVLTDS